MKIGTTTIPVAGWLVDPRQPKIHRTRRLAAIRRIVVGYGLSAVELSLDLGIVYPHVFDADFYATVADLQQELGFVCTVHLPFLWIDSASMNEPLRQASVDCLGRAIELTQSLEVTAYVMHPWGMVTTQIAVLLERPTERQAFLSGMMAQVERSLAQVCQILDPSDLCVETLEAPPFEVMLPLVEKHGCSICLDVGHFNWSGGSELEFLARYGDRIREVHLHDVVHAATGSSAQSRDHLPLGQGELDFRALLHELGKMGFEGPVILENNSQADLEESLEHLQLMGDLRH
jgi:sugar phosphate isomerase/epimerase